MKSSAPPGGPSTHKRTGAVAESTYLRLFEKSPHAMFVIDESGQVLLANESLHRLLGYTSGQLMERPTADWILSTSDPTVFQRPCTGTFGQQLEQCTGIRLRCGDGAEQRMELHCTQYADGWRLATIRQGSPIEASRQADADRLAAIVDSSEDAIIGNDLDSTITSWNRGAETILGYSASEMLGKSIFVLIPAERRAEELEVLDRIERGERIVGFETQRLTRDGHRIEVSITVSPIRNCDGRIIGASQIARDVTDTKANLRELDRMCRLYAALSQVNQAIVWTRGRQQLFDRTCRVLIEHGGFQLVWVGWHDSATQRLKPIATWGKHAAYAQEIEVYTDDQPEGRGPSGQAFREGAPVICNDLLNEPTTEPWHDAMRRYGFRSSAVFPLKENGQVAGTLSVYAGEPGFFQSKEVALLREAAGDVSFALGNLALEEARRNAENAAENERNFSETMIESTPGVLYFYNADGGFLRWNKNFETVTGYSSSEIKDMGPLDFFSEEDHGCIAAKIGEVFSKGDAFVEAPLRCKNGQTIPHLLTGRRVVFNGEPCLVGIGIDISERMEAERALTQARDELEAQVASRTADLLAALSRAEAADKIKSAFLATMSHELRTPLNSIIGFTGILSQGLAGPINEEQSKQLSMVQSSAAHLLDLINDVLDISKIESGQMDLHIQRFNLRASIERTVASVRPMAERKGLGLTLKISPEVTDIRSDPRRVEQMLLNLLNNAIKFTENGSVTLTAEIVAADNYSQESARRDVIRVQVIDTGIGIKPEDLATLFQPFRQVDSSLTRQYEGTGLGLAICRRLASMLGGEIKAGSEWSKGSVFEIILPTGLE